MDTFIFIVLILILVAACYLLFGSLKKAKAQIISDAAKISVLQNEKEELVSNKNELNSKISSLNDHIQKLNEYVEQMNQHYSGLKKYEPIQNVEADIEKRWQEYLSKEKEASEQHKIRVEDLENRVRLKQSELNHMVEHANEQAARIIEKANINAKEIAAEAWDVKNNIKFYEDALGAIQRRIYGYGEEWVIPSANLLDDLADEYSFEQAGQNLKFYRSNSKNLSKQGRGAYCDFHIEEQSKIAVRFVTESFNGLVDGILAKVKHDNYGKLKKQIEDAFAVTNYNGKSFLATQITQEYLESRLLELEWGTKAHQLRIRDREEQKRAKALLREEQKAKREYENAMKAAQKEEELIQKAMDDAKKNLEQKHLEDKLRYEKELAELQRKRETAEENERANVEKAMQDAQREMEEALAREKEQYEGQLSELQQKWEEAEERNQRAKSMAQQTKKGHVYVISNIGSFGENIYKIGMTRRLDPMDRVKELGDASVPFEFDVHAIIFSDDAPTLETKLHHAFEEKRVNKINRRKEFFKTSLASIKELTDSEELDCHWTIKAKAEQFKESLALEHQSEQNALS
jgi:hypothetical protein